MRLFSVPFFDRFLMGFSQFFLSSSNPESQLNASGLVFSWFLRFKGSIDFRSDFGAKLAPFWYQKSTKHLSNIY